MRRFAAAALVAATALIVRPARAGQDPLGGSSHMLNLSCVEALVASGHAELAGVFSFVSDKDAPAAFADLAVHDAKALKKYVAKLDADYKTSAAITEWDHSTVEMILSIYGSPLAATLSKPSSKLMSRLAELGQAPTTTLEQLTSKRGRA